MSNEIRYSADVRPDPQSVIELFRDSGIVRPVNDVDRIAAMIDNANLIVTAWDGPLLVGMARSLTDFRYCCYVSDLAVRADYQHKGIGRNLLERTKWCVGDETTVLLLSAPLAMDYYPKLGFAKADHAFLIKRAR